MLSRCFSTIGVAVLLVGCGSPEAIIPSATSSTAAQTPAYGAAPVSTEKKWYEGGDLHQASSIGQWRAATYENKLATSADMVANLKQFSSLEAMKSAAEELRQCVSKAAEGAQSEQRVSEVAAACAILLGY